MTAYAQIPTHLICRFGELTKTEIVVLSYLYATRNRKTGQCNPSRSAIARAVQVDRAHISPAIKNLDQKGWICEELSGNFLLLDNPKIVTKSAQVSRAKSAQGGVRNASQDCAESVTKVCGIGNKHIRISSEQKKEQKKEQKTAPAVVSDASRLMSYHAKRIGVITDGGTQGKSIQTLLKNFSLEDCLRYYDYQTKQLRTAGGWRDSVSWSTVLSGISEWVTAGRLDSPPEKNGSNHNATGKKSHRDIFAESAEFYDKYPS